MSSKAIGIKALFRIHFWNKAFRFKQKIEPSLKIYKPMSNELKDRKRNLENLQLHVKQAHNLIHLLFQERFPIYQLLHFNFHDSDHAANLFALSRVWKIFTTRIMKSYDRCVPNNELRSKKVVFACVRYSLWTSRTVLKQISNLAPNKV